MMTTMNSNMKRNRGGRSNPGGRNDKRTMYNPQDRQGGVRQRTTPDKNTPIPYEGVYKNTRYTHVAFSLVGSNVRVQVKNGTNYEGVLKTVSAQGDVVLELAHKVEEKTNSSNSQTSAPSIANLMDKLIVRHADLIMVNVANVDLDYAVKDNFTDAGISKHNGEVTEKTMKELEPWVGEREHDVGGLESEKSNGWDPHDMFRRNAENFNVISSYDDSLSQYTTKLEKKDTEEYRRREEVAAKLAAEIEDTSTYKKNIALENGEGDLDEETRFSAVVRVTEQNSTQSHSAPFVQSSGGPGKYVPPNKRNGPGSVARPTRGGYHPLVGRNPPGHPPTPPTSQQQQPPVPVKQPPPPGPSPSSEQGQSTVKSPPRLEPLNVNGEEPPPLPTSTASPTVKVPSPVNEQSSSKGTDNKPETSHNPTSPGTNKSVDNSRKTGKASPTVMVSSPAIDQAKTTESKSDTNLVIKTSKTNESVDCKETDTGREKQIEAFKQFSDTIKLGVVKDKTDTKEPQESTSEKEKRIEVSQQKTEESPSQERSSHSQEPPSRTEQDVQSIQKTEVPPGEPNRQHTEEQKKYVLNPLAQEFVPGSKPPQKQSAQPQVPTPPHPTQSPLAIQQPLLNIPQQMLGAGQIFMPQPSMFINGMGGVPTQQTQLQRAAKRAVVSVKPENTAAVVQAATGQPLLAAQSGTQSFVYMPHMMPQQNYHPQMGQVMPMPPANPRYMTPGSGGMPSMVPSSLPATVEPNNQTHTGQTGPIFMQTPQGGPVPAHMSTQPTHLTHPAHMPHPQMSNPQTQQNTQMNPSSHHPPAPSPVHTTGPNPQQPLNQGHPPSSGTPQPPQGYPQATLQPRPPLQPSPHNPTSPQNLPQHIYPFNTSHSHPMQMQGGPQFSMTPHSSTPSSVTYSMQGQPYHSPHMHHQPQIVMMPPHPNTGPVQHPHIHTTQFQGHPMAGPGSVHGQAQMIPQPGMGVQGLAGATSQGGHPPSQMQQYLPQGLTAAAALTNAMHARPDHFIVQHVRK